MTKLTYSKTRNVGDYYKYLAVLKISQFSRFNNEILLAESRWIPNFGHL